MPLDSTLTELQDPPRRVALDDLDGGACENDAEHAPVPGIDPSAEAMNQRDKQIVAMSPLVWEVELYIVITAGTPAVSAILAQRRGDLVTGDFTPTDNGAGDTSIVHAGGKLPPATRRPSVEQADDVEIDRLRAVSITNGARVKSKLGASGTDCNFVLRLSGV